MFVINPGVLDQDDFIIVGKRTGRYLVKVCDISPMAMTEDKYIFAKTEEVNDKVNKMPLFYRLTIIEDILKEKIFKREG